MCMYMLYMSCIPGIPMPAPRLEHNSSHCCVRGCVCKTKTIDCEEPDGTLFFLAGMSRAHSHLVATLTASHARRYPLPYAR